MEWQFYYADIKTYCVKYWGYLPLSPLPLPHSPQDFSHQLMTSASSHPNSGISLELQSSPFSSRQSETVTRYQIVIMRHWDYDLDFIYIYMYIWIRISTCELINFSIWIVIQNTVLSATATITSCMICKFSCASLHTICFAVR